MCGDVCSIVTRVFINVINNKWPQRYCGDKKKILPLLLRTILFTQWHMVLARRVYNRSEFRIVFVNFMYILWMRLCLFLYSDMFANKCVFTKLYTPANHTFCELRMPIFCLFRVEMYRRPSYVCVFVSNYIKNNFTLADAVPWCCFVIANRIRFCFSEYYICGRLAK